MRVIQWGLEPVYPVPNRQCFTSMQRMDNIEFPADVARDLALILH